MDSSSTDVFPIVLSQCSPSDNSVELSCTPHPDDERNGATLPLVRISVQGINYLASYLGFWHTFSKFFTMKIHNDSIKSRSRNATLNIYLEIVIYADSVLKYEFNMPEDSVLFSVFNSAAFGNSIRASQKKAIGCFTIWPGDTSIVYTTSEVSTDTDGAGAILIGANANEELKEFEVPEIKGVPIVKILVSELMLEIGNATKAKASQMCFIPYKRGLHIAGVNAANSEVSFRDFGYLNESFESLQTEETVVTDPELQSIMDMMKRINPNASGFANYQTQQPMVVHVERKSDHVIMVPMEQIRNLGKLKHCSLDPDFLSVYYEPGEALIFEGNIGNFGKHYIYLKNTTHATQ